MAPSIQPIGAPIYHTVKTGENGEEKMEWMFTVLAAGHASQGAVHVVSWLLSIGYSIFFVYSTSEKYLATDEQKTLAMLAWLMQLLLVPVIAAHSAIANNQGRFADTWHQIFMFFFLTQFGLTYWLFQWGYFHVPDGQVQALIVLMLNANASGIALSNFIKYSVLNPSNAKNLKPPAANDNKAVQNL